MICQRWTVALAAIACALVLMSADAHARAGGGDLFLFGGEQQAHHIDDEIGTAERLDRDAVAA